jgi:hypothetical protein
MAWTSLLARCIQSVSVFVIYLSSRTSRMCLKLAATDIVSQGLIEC